MSKVYFIGAGSRVKIGYSSDPEKRLTELQVGNPDRLTILATLDGGAVLENTIHAAFARDRLDGEWFRISRELLELINEIRRYQLAPIVLQEAPRSLLAQFQCYRHATHRQTIAHEKLLYLVERLWRYTTIGYKILQYWQVV